MNKPPLFKIGDTVYNTDDNLPIIGKIDGIWPLKHYVSLVNLDDMIDNEVDLSGYIYFVKFNPTKFVTDTNLNQACEDYQAITQCDDSVIEYLKDTCNNQDNAVFLEEDIAIWDDSILI